MQISVLIYQRKSGSYVEWSTVSRAFIPPIVANGSNAHKVQQKLTNELHKRVTQMKPAELPLLELVRGTRLQRIRIEFVHRSEQRKKVSALCPLLIESRSLGHSQFLQTENSHSNENSILQIAYHPLRPHEWFAIHENESLEAQANLFFATTLRELDEEQINELWTDGKDMLRVVAFSAKPRSLLDALPKQTNDIWGDLRIDPLRSTGKPQTNSRYQVLPSIATNVTTRVLDQSLTRGHVRSPYREQLQTLLCNTSKKPFLLIGPNGVGKTTILHQCIYDRISTDGYEAHRNLDRVHDVWMLSGKRLIAGMSYVGDWEERCLKVLEDARDKLVIVWVEDIHLFGQIGRSQQSDRTLADFLRGPLARGEIILIGECTREQLALLENEAPDFASLFTPIYVEPTSPTETFRLMLHEARALELAHDIVFSPYALRSILELGSSLLPNKALPGKTLDALKQIARQHSHINQEDPSSSIEINSTQIIEFLSKKTGLPSILLQSDESLDLKRIQNQFESYVMGQPNAIKVAVDLIARIKSGLTDAHRPYGVYLFTGPTGVGKTELAKCIADYLYGAALKGEKRLLRFDMSEFASSDAAARLVGDRWQPEGLLTSRIQEQPFSVVLFDEIEKAHSSVLNLLLQLFDEGRLTDARGYTANFCHSVIIMTSNLGARSRAAMGFGETNVSSMMADVAQAVREFFAPELFNRIDQIVPFFPLNRDVALDVTHKELNKILNRYGLTERNIFVSINHGVLEKIVHEAFEQRDGARALKRYLEDTIGTLLATEIAQTKQASMQLLRIFVRSNQDYGLHHEILQEAVPIETHYALSNVIDKPIHELRAQLEPSLVFLRTFQQSDELTKLSEQIRFHLREHNRGRREHSDSIYTLEHMQLEIQRFRERIEQELASEQEATYEKLEFQMHMFTKATKNIRNWDRASALHTRMRLFDPRSTSFDQARMTRNQIVESIAEVQFLKRALSLVHDPTQHAVFVEITRISNGTNTNDAGRFANNSASFLFWMLEAYTHVRGEIEEVSLRTKQGDIITDSYTNIRDQLGDANYVVLKIVGLCVRDFFELETGCHIWRSMSGTPEILRVYVSPAKANTSTQALISTYHERIKEFELALESGTTERPVNPAGLLPIVRMITFEPKRSGEITSLELEDYTLGETKDFFVRTLVEALEYVWLLRLSRAS